MQTLGSVGSKGVSAHAWGCHRQASIF